MKCKQAILFSALLLGSTVAIADSLVGKDRFLCAGVEAMVCTPDGVCDSGPALDFKVPGFVLVDVKKQTLATTDASGENRQSPIRHLTREGGQIILQGTENLRAFSMVLHEEDGLASIAIALDGLTINVFGKCTPVPVK
jgi:hypothetical protein